jgi:hypothetical protein
MKVKIGNVVIPDATVKRFIDMESGLPLSMIRITYFGNRISDEQIVDASHKQGLLPFESEVLKTFVLIHGFAESEKEKKHEYTLQERAADVSCGYMLLHTKVGNEKAIIVPEDVEKNLMADVERFRKLPYIRYILKKDIPEDRFSEH